MVKKVLIIMVIMFMFLSNVSAYKLSFDEGDKLIMNEVQNPIILHLTIDNRIYEAGTYISENSELSYLDLKVIGENENLVRIVNEKDYEGKGKYHDKEFIETIDIELRLPVTEKWKKEYVIQIAGISPDNRQEIAQITVVPTGENVETAIDKINMKFLISGVIGLVLIILAVIVISKFTGGKKTKW